MSDPSIPDEWLDLGEAEILQRVKALQAKRRAEKEKGEGRLEKALDGVFDSYAPGGEWLPQEFVVSFTLVRLKTSPKAYPKTRERLLALLESLQDTRFKTQKGVGKGVRRLRTAPSAAPKRSAKKAKG